MHHLSGARYQIEYRYVPKPRYVQFAIGPRLFGSRRIENRKSSAPYRASVVRPIFQPSQTFLQVGDTFPGQSLHPRTVIENLYRHPAIVSHAAQCS